MSQIFENCDVIWRYRDKSGVYLRQESGCTVSIPALRGKSTTITLPNGETFKIRDSARGFSLVVKPKNIELIKGSQGEITGVHCLNCDLEWHPLVSSGGRFARGWNECPACSAKQIEQDGFDFKGKVTQ